MKKEKYSVLEDVEVNGYGIKVMDDLAFKEKHGTPYHHINLSYPRDRKYSPELFIHEGVIRISTTSYGSLPIEEIEKMMSAFSQAVEAGEEFNKIIAKYAEKEELL